MDKRTKIILGIVVIVAIIISIILIIYYTTGTSSSGTQEIIGTPLVKTEMETKQESKSPTQETTPNVWLTEHNRIRANVGQKPVIWNQTIANGATNYANTCNFNHSSQSSRTLGNSILGENLASGSPFNNFTDAQMVGMWEAEKQNYTYPQPPNTSATQTTGHYTQMINKNVIGIGCGCANCNNSKFCVCRYDPIQLGNQPPY